MRLPVIYLPHGGGPWPFVELPMFEPAECAALRAYLSGLPASLPEPPRALLCVTAHWEEPVPTVSSAKAPGMLYDYHGFPPESYELVWPAPGDPSLASRVRALLEGAGIASGDDAERGFDHGTFVPLMVAWPNEDGARVPCVQLSLVRGLDPAKHLALGRALAPLRDEGVLLVGSGMSYHDLGTLMTRRGRARSEPFDAWLGEIAGAPADERDEALERWETAPNARLAHPRAEHLLPLMVVAGAAGEDAGRTAFRGLFGDAWIRAIHFGGAA